NYAHGGDADADGHQAVDDTLAEASGELGGEALADELFHDAIGEHQAAGYGEVAEDGAKQAEGAEDAGAGTVEAGDVAAQPDAFEDDDGDIDEGAVRHGGYERDAAGRGRGESPGAHVERGHQRELGEADVFAAVEEVAAAGGKCRAG